jgi:hypothetical protein
LSSPLGYVGPCTLNLIRLPTLLSPRTNKPQASLSFSSLLPMLLFLSQTTWLQHTNMTSHHLPWFSAYLRVFSSIFPQLHKWPFSCHLLDRLGHLLSVKSQRELTEWLLKSLLLPYNSIFTCNMLCLTAASY